MAFALAEFVGTRNYPELGGASTAPASHTLGKWYFGSAVAALTLAIAWGILNQAVSLFQSTAHLGSKFDSLHTMTAVHLCWIPGSTLAIASLQNPDRRSRSEIRARWVGLILLWLSGAILLGSELFAHRAVGFRTYLHYFDDAYRTGLVQAVGVACGACFLAVNGWQWMTLPTDHRADSHTASLDRWLAVVGAAQVLLGPIALAVPALMLLEQTRGFGIFLPSLGGDPRLLSNLFWFYAQPAFCLATIPVFAIFDLTFARFARHQRPHLALTSERASALVVLSFLTWGTRSEVAFSPSIRSGFAFAGMLLLLVLGRSIVAVSSELMEPRTSTAVLKLTTVPLFALALGVLLGMPQVLPASAQRWSGTALEQAQLHLLTITAMLLWPIVVHTRQIRRFKEIGILRILPIGVGACVLCGAEVYAAIHNEAPTRTAIALATVLLAFGWAIQLRRAPGRAEVVNPEHDMISRVRAA